MVMDINCRQQHEYTYQTHGTPSLKVSTKRCARRMALTQSTLSPRRRQSEDEVMSDRQGDGNVQSCQKKKRIYPKVRNSSSLDAVNHVESRH